MQKTINVRPSCRVALMGFEDERGEWWLESWGNLALDSKGTKGMHETVQSRKEALRLLQAAIDITAEAFGYRPAVRMQ